MNEEKLAGIPNNVDRTGWPKGPWDTEPDRVDWKTEAGLPAIALRHSSGHWCGYVGVPTDHPALDADAPAVDVHGGITYGSKCSGHVCHIPEPGEPADVFWFGFDFAHNGDANPSAWEIESGANRWRGNSSSSVGICEAAAVRPLDLALSAVAL